MTTAVFSLMHHGLYPDLGLIKKNQAGMQMRTRGVELNLIRSGDAQPVSLSIRLFFQVADTKNNNTLISEWRSIGITRCNQIILKYVFLQ